MYVVFSAVYLCCTCNLQNAWLCTSYEFQTSLMHVGSGLSLCTGSIISYKRIKFDARSLCITRVQPCILYVISVISDTQCHLVALLSHYLKELKTAIPCLGIKPKAIDK